MLVAVRYEWVLVGVLCGVCGERGRGRLRYDFFFFNDAATTEIYTLPLHDALPSSCKAGTHWIAASMLVSDPAM